MPPFSYKPNIKINFFCINHNDILLIIKNLDLTKAHGCGNILIKMIQICGESVALLLKLLFDTALKEKKNSRHMKISKCSSCSPKARRKFVKKQSSNQLTFYLYQNI